MPVSMNKQQPARSKLEAVTRLSSISQSPQLGLGPGSKERKSTLTDLGRRLGLKIDTRVPKPEVGRQLADALGAEWDAACWSSGQTITLVGLNRLLLGAEAHIATQRRGPQLTLFEEVRAPDGKFTPARSKLEAVTRMSALTGSPPETLGPGSKERKSALLNLASGLSLDVNARATKPVLGAEIARFLGVEWDAACWSAGATITLQGLNRLLYGAEHHLTSREVSRSGLFQTPADEGRALLVALQSALPAHWDGEDCVREMLRAEYSQWAQDEWAAFYFEFLGLPGLINTFGGGPRTFANTRFDYALAHTWDLKVHMATSGVAPLNDCRAVDAALDTGSGMGFLVLTGVVEYDDGEFRSWQREFRAANGKAARQRSSVAKYVRKSKRGFAPRMLEAFFLPDHAVKEAAVAAGILRVMHQGTQTTGHARRPKYSIDLVKARMSNDLLLAQLVL